MRAEPVVLVGPSGAGKTTIATRLVDLHPQDFALSVSATTRSPRSGEVPGRDYHFVSADEFKAMIGAGQLAEWAQVHGEYYGTPVRNLSRARSGGPTPILDIDVQGAGQVMKHAPCSLVIFIVPPGPNRWIRRLVGRGTESSRQIARRLRTALRELGAARSLGEFVVNEDLDSAVEQVLALARGTPVRSVADQQMDHLCEELESRARLEIARLEQLDHPGATRSRRRE